MRKIGDGKIVFFWHDKWWEGEISSQLVNNETVNSNFMEGKEKICDMIDNGKWKWHDECNSCPIIQTVPVPVLSSGKCDSTVWTTNEGQSV